MVKSWPVVRARALAKQPNNRLHHNYDQLLDTI